MKLYTNSEQTAKLIELGFDKPKTLIDKYYDFDAEAYVEVKAYSIGELLSFLPLAIQWTPRIISGNVIEYSFVIEGSELYYCNAHNELIDNLFDMCVKLKEARVI